MLCSLLLLLLAATSCRDPESANEESAFIMPVVFESIAWGHSGVTRDTLEVVYRDSASWARGRMAVSPLGPARPVDFSQNMVVLIAVPTPSGGYLVTVDGIDEHADFIEVSYTLTKPGPNCITVQATGLPFRAVAVRRSELPARFVRRTDYEDCVL